MSSVYVSSTDKLVKFLSTFAGTEDVGFVVHDLGLVDVHLLQDLFAFYHADFAVVGSC